MLNANVIEKKPPINSRQAHFGGQPASPFVTASSAVAASAKEDAAKAEMKSEKSEKWFFAFFQSEPAAAQSVPTEIAFGHFSDFSKNFRGYTGGVPSLS